MNDRNMARAIDVQKIEELTKENAHLRARLSETSFALEVMQRRAEREREACALLCVERARELQAKIDVLEDGEEKTNLEVRAWETHVIRERISKLQGAGV